MNRLTALRAFVTVVESGSFAEAARKLGTSAAAISKNIRELEADLGVRLFHRTTRAMSVTDPGAIYYERMRKLLSEMDEADIAVSALDREPRGRLCVAAPMSIGLLILAPLVPVFLKLHPKIVMDLHLDDEKDDLVRAGFDLAIRGTAQMPDSTLISRKLATLDHIAVASAEYLERKASLGAPELLREHPCLLYSNSDRPERWTFRNATGEERQIRVTGPLIANNSLMLREAVLAGSGVAVMPRLYVEADLATGKLANALEGWKPPDQAIYAIYPPSPGGLPRVRAFIDFLAKHLKGFVPMTPEDPNK